MKITGVQTVTINYKAQNSAIEDKFLEYLNKEYPAEWELTDDGVIKAMEVKEGYYYPGCRYTRNGDGYPDEYDVEFDLYEDDIRDLSRKFETENEGSFELASVISDFESIDDDYDYYVPEDDDYDI